MKTKYTPFLIVLMILLTGITGFTQHEPLKTAPEPEKMTIYYMAFLKRGPDRSHDSLTAAKIQEGHMAHIMQMAEDKKLVLAGPFMDNGDLRGIFIFNVASIEEAVELTNQDPAVKSGRLVMEIHPWFGPEKLKEIEW
ncbi:MAG: YciI family protein [Lentimicrobium sp.]